MADEERQSVIRFEPAEPTFGRIEHARGDEPTLIVTMRNTTAEPVRVSKVVTGCGCVVSDSLEPVELKPGGSLALQLRLKRNEMRIGRNGSELAAFDGEHKLQGRTEVIYEYDPPLVAETRELHVNSNKVGDVPGAETIVHARREHGVPRAESDCEHAVVTLHPEPGSALPRKYRLGFALRPEHPVGKHEYAVRVFSDGSSQPDLVVPVHVMVGIPLELRPRVVLLGSIVPESKIRRTVRIQKDAAYKLSRLRTSCAAIEAKESAKGGEDSVEVNITVPPSGDLFDESITLVFAGPSKEVEVVVAVVGEIIALPEGEKRP